MSNRTRLSSFKAVTPLLGVVSTTLLLSTAAQAMADRSLSVACVDAPDAFCDAVTDRLVAEMGANTVLLPADADDAELSVILVISSKTVSSITGHLTWSHQGAAPVQGPDVELTTQDSPLRPDAPAQFAAGVIHATELPI